MKFKLSSQITVSAYTEVDADNIEEAVQIAGSREGVIGGIGTGADPAEFWIVQEVDGLPKEIIDLGAQ